MTAAFQSGAFQPGAFQGVRARGWDDGGWSRGRPIVIYPDEDEEPKKLKKPVKAKVTRKAVRRVLESAESPPWPLSLGEAVRALPEFVSIIPQAGPAVDQKVLDAAIMVQLRREMVRRETERQLAIQMAQEDEEDIELLLMSA